MTLSAQLSNAASVARALSRERLAAYSGGTTLDVATGAHYAWNVALCEALYPSLHVLEVTLRNQVFNVVEKHYRKPGFRWRDIPCWLDATHPILDQGGVNEVEQAKTRLFRTLKRKFGAQNWRRQITPGRLVAELQFGFWTYLFRSRYAASSISPGAFWPHLLPVVFPNLPQGMQRGTVERRLDAARVLRNRVFHHEANWRDPNLSATHDSIVEMCGWLCLPVQSELVAFERFALIRRPAVERYLRAQLSRRRTLDQPNAMLLP